MAEYIKGNEQTEVLGNRLVRMLSRLLGPNSKIVIHTNLSQAMIMDPNAILLKDIPLEIDSSLYDKIKVALRRRGATLYNSTSTMIYADFCICMLWSQGYTMNHITTPEVSARAYVAAWRAIVTIAGTAEADVGSWVNLHLQGRTASGYAATHNVQLHSDISIAYSSERTSLADIDRDSNILYTALSLKLPDGRYDVVDVTNNELMPTISSTPTSQLRQLLLGHLSLTKYGNSVDYK